MMDRIACKVESDALYQSMIDSQRSPPEATTPDAIMAAVHEVTQTIERQGHHLLDQVRHRPRCARRASAPRRPSSR